MVTSYADWSSTEGYKSYGGSSTTWNVSLTPADVNASNFGVAFTRICHFMFICFNRVMLAIHMLFK